MNQEPSVSSELRHTWVSHLLLRVGKRLEEVAAQELEALEREFNDPQTPDSSHG